MKKLIGIFILPLLLFASTVIAQKKLELNAQNYDQMKRSGQLESFLKKSFTKNKLPVIVPSIQTNLRTIHNGNTIESIHAQCNCSVPLDPSFQVAPFTVQNGGTCFSGTGPPNYRNDDCSTLPILLPFNFCFYGQSYNTVFINNNGNITFNHEVYGFSSGGFPAGADTVMIAPFWADVDTRGPNSGLVYYKITPTSMIVKWESVGYYGTHDDKLNTFQLIITDGTDPILPTGNNVDFCYGDMGWTTGDASGGHNGFGDPTALRPVPATVGANAGNALDFIQFGRFLGPGYSYDGPFGGNDSVDFLDNQNFIFNTCTSGGATNIPPILHGFTVCDTIIICALDTAFRDTIPISLDFLAPEQGQNTTITASYVGGGIFSIQNVTSGSVAHIDATLILTNHAIGINTVRVIATDDGTPAATDTLNISFKIDTFPLAPPVITGPNYYCAGSGGVTLNVQPVYQDYLWSDGTTGVNTHNVTTGTYNVEVTNLNGCKAKTPAFPVYVLNLNPVIGGITAMCGQDSAQLQTTQPFLHYDWLQNGNPTGDTTSTLTVGTGNYSVTVTDPPTGCSATSSVVNVAIHPYPTASFSFAPEHGLAGVPIQFTDHSTAVSGSIVGWHWNFGDSTNSVSSSQNPSHIYTTIGSYPVTLTVTQSDGCSKTITVNYTGEPNEIIASNILTPNNDGANETFYFKNLEYFPNSKLEIFNRWGRKVYESNNYQNDWKGDDLSDGVYYYTMKIPQKDALKGTVTIKK